MTSTLRYLLWDDSRAMVARNGITQATAIYHEWNELAIHLCFLPFTFDKLLPTPLWHTPRILIGAPRFLRWLQFGNSRMCPCLYPLGLPLR